jgi:hypothetical protein
MPIMSFAILQTHSRRTVAGVIAATRQQYSAEEKIRVVLEGGKFCDATVTSPEKGERALQRS